ncbi:exported hypothetical protein [uncultured Desulfobacterium sp.]|uniref:Uncharacterized protein n=1 Tax=uncultured Desulfobacterium sp. TaxID=201089 RepID=A0A445MT11_9BACT|nr:exported hypothetical protein [uncultured Desulfobacterium sp.]
MKTLNKLLVAAIFVLLSAPAWAGNIPEFDAVGCDNQNFFAITNAAQHVPVIINNIGPRGPINNYSAFNNEYFHQTAGQLFPDPCFPQISSALTDVYNEAVYEWRIVLQMKPESDINLNIYDCILKHNEYNIFTAAEQSGRYRAPWGQLFFLPSANPSVTVTASPGPYATPGFMTPVILDARTMPGLNIVALNDILYTSKAHWEEGIVMVLPETGTLNSSGQTVYNLKQGDVITTTVTIPANNTADIRYGQDNVILKYIGIIGTWYYGNACQTPG